MAKTINKIVQHNGIESILKGKKTNHGISKRSEKRYRGMINSIRNVDPRNLGDFEEVAQEAAALGNYSKSDRSWG